MGHLYTKEEIEELLFTDNTTQNLLDVIQKVSACEIICYRYKHNKEAQMATEVRHSLYIILESLQKRVKKIQEEGF